jgi:hypothetical protein
MGAAFAVAAEYVGSLFAVEGAAAGAAGAAGGAAGAAGGAAGGSALGAIGTAAATGIAGAVAADALAPDPDAPKVQKQLGAPDPQAQEAARKRSLAEQLTRRGRASTVLTGGSGTLGG